jgi:hypothetical protein
LIVEGLGNPYGPMLYSICRCGFVEQSWLIVVLSCRLVVLSCRVGLRPGREEIPIVVKSEYNSTRRQPFDQE